MPRPKRTNKPLPKIAHRATGRAKRGVVAPVAQVVAMNTPRRRLQRPEVEVMADLVEMIERELQVELV